MRAYNPSSTNPLRKGWGLEADAPATSISLLWAQGGRQQKLPRRAWGDHRLVVNNWMRWCLRSLHWGHGTCFHFWGHPEIKQSVKSIHWNQYESISFSHNASSLRFFSNKICGSPTYPLYFFPIDLLYSIPVALFHPVYPSFMCPQFCCFNFYPFWYLNQPNQWNQSNQLPLNIT